MKNDESHIAAKLFCQPIEQKKGVILTTLGFILTHTPKIRN